MEFASFVKGRKQYRAVTGGIDKVWNHGMGLISFIRVEKGIVYINAAFWRKMDAKLAAAIVAAVKRETGATPNIVCQSLCYPNYYFMSLGDDRLNADDETSRRISQDIAYAA